MTANIRTCFVVNAVGETSVPADIATGLASHTGIDVDILAWWQADPFENDGRVDVTCLHAPDTKLGIDRQSYRRCIDLFRNYDLVQAHHCHSGSIAKVIAARCGVPIVSREGNMRRGFTRMGLVANGLTNPLADRIVCNSRAVLESFRSWERPLVDESRITIIPNGVDLDRVDAAEESASPLPPALRDSEDLVLGTAGMLTEQKDHATLLSGFAAARDRLRRPIHLVIAGDGERRTDLESLTERLGLEGCVHFLGLLDRTEVYSMLHDLDIYAMPSRWEGFSAAAVEALAARTACVFSDITAFTYPYRDVATFHAVGDSADLADRLVELATDSDRRAALAAAGRRLVEAEYRIETVAEAYAALYDDVLRS